MARHDLRSYFAVLTGLLFIGVACVPNRPEQVSPPPEPTWSSNGASPTFVGTAACQACHEAEFSMHRGSRHASTLLEASARDLKDNSPRNGPIPGGCALKVGQDGVLLVDAPSASGTGREAFPLTFALGSGKTGITFLSIVRAGSFDLHKSYFPKDRSWRTTPGQESYVEGEVARKYTVPETRRCLSCHAVAVSDDPIDLEQRSFGVGCESCHGAGGEHVSRMAAVLPGQKTGVLGLKSLVGMKGDEVSNLCGKCHRTAQDVAGLKAFEKESTNRFQPYGLSLSRCFKESKGALTCITCHNPHADAGTDPKPYETACLSCHASGDTKKKPCPVNPNAKCVECHMPTRPALKNNPLPITMADHFIRIYRKKR